MKRLGKKAILFIGIVLGFIFYLVVNTIIDFIDLNIESRIDLISTIANGVFALFIAFVIQKYLIDRSSLKEYFIKDIGAKQIKYESFLNDIKNGKLNSEIIKQDFKSFSISFFQLNMFLTNEMEISAVQIQKCNREIHNIVTSSLEFNNQYTEDRVKLEPRELKLMFESLKNFNHFCTDAIIKINKQ